MRTISHPALSIAVVVACVLPAAHASAQDDAELLEAMPFLADADVDAADADTSVNVDLELDPGQVARDAALPEEADEWPAEADEWEDAHEQAMAEEAARERDGYADEVADLEARREAWRAADRAARPLYMDFGVRASRAPDNTLLFEPAIEISRQVSTHMELGLGFSGGSAPLVSGKRSSFTVAPSIGWRVGWPRLHGYAHLGMAAQYRSGARLPDGKSLAVFGALGARVNLGLCIITRPGRRSRGCMTAGTEVRLLRAMTGGWLMDPAVLPRGASTLATSLTLGWEV